MKVKSENRPIFLVPHDEIPESLQGIRKELFVLQKHRQIFRACGKTASEQFIIHEKLIVTVLMKIPQLLCKLGSLVGYGLIQDHLRRILTAVYQFLGSLGNLLPRKMNRFGIQFRMIAPCKFHSFFIKPYGIFYAVLHNAFGSVAVFLFEKFRIVTCIQHKMGSNTEYTSTLITAHSDHFVHNGKRYIGIQKNTG